MALTMLSLRRGICSTTASISDVLGVYRSSTTTGLTIDSETVRLAMLVLPSLPTPERFSLSVRFGTMIPACLMSCERSSERSYAQANSVCSPCTGMPGPSVNSMVSQLWIPPIDSFTRFRSVKRGSTLRPG